MLLRQLPNSRAPFELPENTHANLLGSNVVHREATISKIVRQARNLTLRVILVVQILLAVVKDILTAAT